MELQKQMLYPSPLNLGEWVQNNRALLHPPVGNKLIHGPQTQFQVQIVGGPNTRTDFHMEVGEEFFLQIEGDMILRVVDGGAFKDIIIKEGQVFLLPGGTPHSPQRYPNTIGLVIERKRATNELDGLRWYCSNCNDVLLHDAFHCEDLGTQLKTKIEEYYSSLALRTCKLCGAVDEKPVLKATVEEAFVPSGRVVLGDRVTHPRIDERKYPDPFDLDKFIESKGDGESLLFGEDTEFKFVLKKGAEEKQEYQATDGECWFYQIKGSVCLYLENGDVIQVGERHTYLLPALVSFTASRDVGSVGLVLRMGK